ncbi:hypothetical protein JOB18_048878 [Solea senegalensis]|nr:hypothetical protein JOB18_048878 [Solea senegalensis]
MAPLGLVDTLGWFSSPEVGIISLVAFFILGVALLALCAQCRRNPSNAYDVNGTTTDGGGTRSAATVSGPGVSTSSTWRNHNNMPVNTLDRQKAYTN